MNSMMIAMDKQFPCNKPLTKFEALVGLSVCIVAQYWQLVWLQQHVNLYVAAIIYSIWWSYLPVVVHVKSWRSISFSKPW